MDSQQSDTLRQANAIKEQYDKTISDFNRDPAKATGISAEELQRRKSTAGAPRNVDIGDKTFKIQSTARAQQIMQKGSNEAQLNKRLEEVKKNAHFLKTVRWVAVGVSAVAIGMIAYTLLLPSLVAQQERGRRMEMRAKRAYMAHMQAEREARLKQSEEHAEGAERQSGEGAPQPPSSSSNDTASSAPTTAPSKKWW